MKYGELDNDKIYIKLKNEVDKAEGKFILLNRLLFAVESISYDMPAFLQGRDGQEVFLSAINRLILDELIVPVGKKPNTHNGLHLKYRINEKTGQKENELVTQIIKNIELPAKVDYYIQHPYDYLNDRSIIESISSFLKQKNINFATVNERAYEIFGDEKFFKGDEKNRSRGEVVLKRLGLDYADLSCEETVEPFFSFYKKEFFASSNRNIFIIENKDTFWSFKRNTMDLQSNLNLDMLIYGEGKKIISSFRFIEDYDVDAEKDTFFYFGDLDMEGINIYCDLKSKYSQYKIIPFYQGYHTILEIGLKRGVMKTPKQQKTYKDNINKFINEFDKTYATSIEKLINGGFYIPQEALSATKIKERFGDLGYD